MLPILIFSIVANIDNSILSILSILLSIYAAYLQISDLNRLIHGPLNTEEIRRIKLRIIRSILLSLLLTIPLSLY